MTEPDSPTAPRRPGRPSTAEHGTFGGASKDRPGRSLGWSDGAWSGDPQSVQEARALCESRTPLPLTATGPNIEADADDPVAALAVAQRVLRYRAVWVGRLPELPDDAMLPDDAIG